MEIYQCPDCELRFRFASELEEHIAEEHPEFHADTQAGEASPFASAHHRRHHESRPETSH